MSDEVFQGKTLPLQPDRDYDEPGGAHEGHAAALNVPCSEGPAHYVLDRPEVSYDELIAEEPSIEPVKMMEAGTEYDRDTLRRLRPLFTPIDEQKFD